MLTGRNHTTVGMACIGESTTGFPNSNGHIPFETAAISEVLVDQGYNTDMLGKWHLCPEDEMNLASTTPNWPLGRGCERFSGYHFSADIADQAIEFISDAKQIAPDKPFFMSW